MSAALSTPMSHTASILSAHSRLELMHKLTWRMEGWTVKIFQSETLCVTYSTDKRIAGVKVRYIMSYTTSYETCWDSCLQHSSHFLNTRWHICSGWIVTRLLERHPSYIENFVDESYNECKLVKTLKANLLWYKNSLHILYSKGKQC